MTEGAAPEWSGEPTQQLPRVSGAATRTRQLEDHHIGKLEPDWGSARRLRSLVLLVVLVTIVALAVAAAFSILVIILGAAANHAISKGGT
jgi:hypothetical protein